MPKGLKKVSAACRWMERVDVNDRCGGMETKRTLVVQSRIEEEEIRVLDQDDDDNNNE